MMNIGLVEHPTGAMRTAPGRRRRYRTATAWVLAAVVGANAAAIIWLWLNGGGVSAVHGLGALSTSVGRLTGLLSAYLALLQVLLLARLPPWSASPASTA